MRADAPPLYPYQGDGVTWMLSRSAGILGDEMGTGKTVQSLALFDRMHYARPDARMLITVRNSLIDLVWQPEIEKWTNFDYELATGTAAQRERAIAAGAPITVIAYDNMAKNLDDLNDKGYHLWVSDEAHYLKNIKANRTRAAFALRSLRRIFMTGSPLLNRVDELWPLLFMCNPVEFGNYWHFVNRYAVFGGYQDKNIIGVQNATELRERIAPYLLRRLKADVLSDLPPKTVVRRYVDLEPTIQAPLVEKIANELLLQIEGGEAVEISNPMTATMRVRQAVITPAIFGHEDKSGKLDAMMGLLDEIGSDQKVAIFTTSVPGAHFICERLSAARQSFARFTGEETPSARIEAVRSFQDRSLASGGPRILVCTYGVATEGVTLHAASHAIMIDKLYVPKLQEQAEDRLHRSGQKNNVTIIEIHARKTKAEQRLDAIFATKNQVFDTVLGADNFGTVVDDRRATLAV